MHREQLEAALACTQRMVDAARAGDWTRVEALHLERAASLVAGAAVATAATRETLARLVALNAELLSTVAQHRDDLGQRAREMRQATRAANAYSRAAG